jgi:hypothetical protein
MSPPKKVRRAGVIVALVAVLAAAALAWARCGGAAVHRDRLAGGSTRSDVAVFIPAVSGFAAESGLTQPEVAPPERAPSGVGAPVSVALRGTVLDAASRRPIARAAVSVEGRGERPFTASYLADEHGRFAFERLPSGRVLLQARGDGCIPLCESPRSPTPGRWFDVAADVDIEVALPTVFVALCAIQNLSNLDDATLGMGLSHEIVRAAGDALPAWFDHGVMHELAGIATALGHTNAYADVCCADASAVVGEMRFSAQGRPAGTAALHYVPLAAFRRAPTPTLHPVSLQWQVARVSIESPLALMLCERGSALVGGVRTRPGVDTFDLPFGAYVVGPADTDTLLDASHWTKTFEVPGPGRIVVSPPQGFAMLHLGSELRSPSATVVCAATGAAMGVPLASLPVSLPVSPGVYRITLQLGAEATEGSAVAWSQEVDVVQGEERVVRVGER